eukprot:SAG11_NODE_286_length_11220_cov_11.922399_9_plen_81_part_00
MTRGHAGLPGIELQREHDIALQQPIDSRYLTESQTLLDVSDVAKFLGHTKFGVGAGPTGSCFEHLSCALESAAGRARRTT